MVSSTTARVAQDVSYRPRSGAAGDGPAWTCATDVQAAVSAAASCATEVGEATPRERTGWLGAVAAAMVAASEELVALADEETALGTSRLSGELSRAAVNMRYYASGGERGEWLRVRKQRLPGPPEIDLRRANLPVGPVAVF